MSFLYVKWRDYWSCLHLSKWKNILHVSWPLLYTTNRVFLVWLRVNIYLFCWMFFMIFIVSCIESNIFLYLPLSSMYIKCTFVGKKCSVGLTVDHLWVFDYDVSLLVLSNCQSVHLLWVFYCFIFILQLLEILLLFAFSHNLDRSN